MATRHSPTARQRRLMGELTRLRKDRGLTQGEVSERIGNAEVTIIRWERGLSRPRPADVAILCDVYEVYGRDREDLVQMAKEARGRDWWYSHRDVLKRGFDVYIGLEAEAVAVRTYEDQVVSGLLQTEAYARAVIAATAMTDTSEVDEKVIVRRERQSVLSGRDPVQLAVVLSETVIRTNVGGPEVMREQLNWLVSASGLPNVTLQVLPFEAGAHAGMDGPFFVLEFPEPDPAVVYLEQASSGLVLEDDADVRRYTLMFGSLTSQALDAKKSRACIAEVAREL